MGPILKRFLYYFLIGLLYFHVQPERPPPPQTLMGTLKAAVPSSTCSPGSGTQALSGRSLRYPGCSLTWRSRSQSHGTRTWTTGGEHALGLCRPGQRHSSVEMAAAGALWVARTPGLKVPITPDSQEE